MSDRLYRLVAFGVISLLSLQLVFPITLFAEDSTPESTPQLSSTPKFALLPVGDYPKGFFEDVEVEPGTSIELALVVDNSSEMALHLRTYSVNALVGVNGGYVSGEVDDVPMGSTEWIDYPTVELTLDPGAQQVITFDVSVPEDASPGQYISGLVVETAEPVPISGTEVLDQVISYAISVGILVPGTIKHSFDLGPPRVEERYLLIPISNSGNSLVRPEGTVTLKNSDGESVVTSTINMGSIYAGLSTDIQIILPEQLEAGNYSLDIALQDPESEAIAETTDAAVVIEAPKDPTGVSVVDASIEPNAEEIVFANVDVTLENGGQQIPASDVTLQVLRDGEQVDEFPLATNQVLLNGENTYTARYIPAEMWEPGTYTFKIEVSAVDPNGGQQTILLDEDLDAEIVVP